MTTSSRGPAVEEVQAGMRPLDRAFFARSAVLVARELLGMVLVRRSPVGVAGGVIVETEAYGGTDDRASHARAGRTSRTAPMFGPPGHAYVYLIYGLHHCLNVVAEPDGVPGAVLLRSIVPLIGVDLMRARRGRTGDPDHRLAAGPARLCHALAVDRSWNDADLTGGRDLLLAHPGADALDAARAPGILAGTRVGVDYAGAGWADRPWRFAIDGHPSLSRPFAAPRGTGAGAR